MAPKMVNVGLIGTGFMGQAHADTYRRAALLYRDLPMIPILHTVADADQSLAEAAARRRTWLPKLQNLTHATVDTDRVSQR